MPLLPPSLDVDILPVCKLRCNVLLRLAEVAASQLLYCVCCVFTAGRSCRVDCRVWWLARLCNSSTCKTVGSKRLSCMTASIKDITAVAWAAGHLLQRPQLANGLFPGQQSVNSGVSPCVDSCHEVRGNAVTSQRVNKLSQAYLPACDPLCIAVCSELLVCVSCNA